MQVMKFIVSHCDVFYNTLRDDQQTSGDETASLESLEELSLLTAVLSRAAAAYNAAAGKCVCVSASVRRGQQGSV